MSHRKILLLLFMFLPVSLGRYATLKAYDHKDSVTQCDAGLLNAEDKVVMIGQVDVGPNKIAESDHVQFTLNKEYSKKDFNIVNISLHNCTGFNDSEDGYCQKTRKEGVYIVVLNSTAVRYYSFFNLVLKLHQSGTPVLQSLQEALPKVIDILDVELFLNDLRTPIKECDISKAVRNDVIKFCCYADPATCNVSIKVNGTIAVVNDTCVEYRSNSLRYSSIVVGYTYCKQTAWILCQSEQVISKLRDKSTLFLFPHSHEHGDAMCDAALKSGTDRLVMMGTIDISRLPYHKQHKIEARITSTGAYKGISVTLPKIELRNCYMQYLLDNTAFCSEYDTVGLYLIVYNVTMEKIYSEAEMQLIYTSPYRDMESSIQILPAAIDQSKEVLQINGENVSLAACNTSSVFKNQTIRFCCYVAPTTCFVSMVINKDYRLSGSGCVDFNSSSIQIYRVDFGYTYCGETKSFTCELPQAVNESVHEKQPVEVESEANWMFILISVIIGASLAFFMKYIVTRIGASFGFLYFVSKIQLAWART